VDDHTDGFTQAAFRFCPGCHAHRFPNSRNAFPTKAFSTEAGFGKGSARMVAERFPHANREFRSRQENGLDTDVKGKFRRKTRIRPGLVVSLRRFRRLFAAVQSSASTKLCNPLINQ
jgi:hypothetical protein